MISVEEIKVGDIVKLPVYPESEYLTGKVVFVKPKRFFRVEFELENGNVLHESYPFYGPLTPRNEKVRGEADVND